MAHSEYATIEGMGQRRCNEPVPTSLCGTLRPGKCALPTNDGAPHAGDHKAHMTLKGIGKVIFRWKNASPGAYGQRQRIIGGSQPPPVITLPPSRIDQPQD